MANVSIGIVSYNRPELLKRAIESATSQTYRDVEIVISDNGSTDPLVRQIIEEFAANDPRIKCLFHRVNQGAFFNFRAALNAATGRYFIWLADDDYWCAEYLENIVATAEQSGAALTYGRCEIVDVDLAGDDRVVKEMKTALGRLAAMTNFVRLDTDAVFYGLFPTALGRKLAGLLRFWRIPPKLAVAWPFLEYNFVSYAFIFGLLSSGGYCNASSENTVHFVGGRSPFPHSPSLGWRHLLLFLMYVSVHLQMESRFAYAAYAAASWPGVMFSPVAVGYLFCRRLGMILSQRLNTLRKV
ncbi:glycosyltransferase family 2 protein [Methylomonas koyamae]|uniref:glycosyltransferase family 2 protein n=1 Tax=Methylomonas koyamae TaxID=702114 RepID=UPI0011273074|nr:glycosyltransferase family 2 protein [Methylomonas koyamae]TPQ28520.1 hypothetical protein C2U68_04750 [Methylomonas koyamae]